MSIQKIQKELATKLVEYHKEVDQYEFKCCYDTDEMAYNENLNILKSDNGINLVIKVLADDVNYYSDLDKDDTNDFYNLSKTILKEVLKYYAELKKLEKGR